MDYGIKGFLSTSLIDWPGRVCSVVFLGGCGFRCPACHNARLVVDPDSMPEYPLQDILLYVTARRNWIDGVTVTGGEPTFRRSLPDLLVRFREHGVKVKLDTNGSNPSMLRELIHRGLVEAVFMDVKAPLTREHYARVSGTAIDPRIIKRSIDLLKASGLEVVFRTTVIPGLVDEPELEQIAAALGEVTRFVIQSFRNQETLSPELADRTEMTPERLDELRNRFEQPSPQERLVRRYARAG